MDCDRWIEPMAARLDGEATPDEVVALDAHLSQCPSCRERWDSFEYQHRRFRLHSAPVVPDLVPLVIGGSRSGRRRWTALAAAVTLAAASVTVGLVVTGVGHGEADPEPAVAAAMVRPSQTGETAVVYLRVANPGGSDTVVGASSPIADHVAFHHSAGHVGEAVMHTVTTVPVPARSSAAFAASGTHVMLVGLRRDLRPGDTVPLRLEFARSGPMDVTATVEATPPS